MPFDWQQPLLETIVPLGVAAFAGALVGWDREAHGKVAGLRTHMLVSLGAALFVLAAVQLSMRTAGAAGVSVDTSRIIEGVATGIGFLGAGSIIKSQRKVEGVTTAASVWVTGAIGAACGARLYLLAAAAAVLALLILWPAGKLESEAFDEPRINR
jgi:putative Mg2+ transporter-C (MgtC) family protein